jgi:hypothetical protein
MAQATLSFGPLGVVQSIASLGDDLIAFCLTRVDVVRARPRYRAELMVNQQHRDILVHL